MNICISHHYWIHFLSLTPGSSSNPKWWICQIYVTDVGTLTIFSIITLYSGTKRVKYHVLVMNYCTSCFNVTVYLNKYEISCILKQTLNVEGFVLYKS